MLKLGMVRVGEGMMTMNFDLTQMSPELGVAIRNFALFCLTVWVVKRVLGWVFDVFIPWWRTGRRGGK